MVETGGFLLSVGRTKINAPSPRSRLVPSFMRAPRTVTDARLTATALAAGLARETVSRNNGTQVFPLLPIGF
jgi:hypothetical protein